MIAKSPLVTVGARVVAGNWSGNAVRAARAAARPSRGGGAATRAGGRRIAGLRAMEAEVLGSLAELEFGFIQAGGDFSGLGGMRPPHDQITA